MGNMTYTARFSGGHLDGRSEVRLAKTGKIPEEIHVWFPRYRREQPDNAADRFHPGDPASPDPRKWHVYRRDGMAGKAVKYRYIEDILVEADL